jgi:hypothetical protein
MSRRSLTYGGTTYFGRELPQPWKEERYPIEKLTQREIVFDGYHMRRIPLEHVDQYTDD